MLSPQEQQAILKKLTAHGGPYARAPSLAPELWRALGGLLRARRLDKGDFLSKEGEKPSDFAIVRSGMLRFYYVDVDGAEATKAFRGPGELAAPYAELLMGIPSRTYIQAMEDSEVLVADFARLHGLFARHQSWQEVARLIAEHFYVIKERREFELLQLSAEERYERFTRDFPGLIGRVSQYHVASYLGITPVALSRIVSRRRRRVERKKRG